MIFQQRRLIQVVSYASAFSHTIKMSNSLDPDQDRHDAILIWLLTVYKGYQQMTEGACARNELMIRPSPSFVEEFEFAMLF